MCTKRQINYHFINKMKSSSWRSVNARWSKSHSLNQIKICPHLWTKTSVSAFSLNNLPVKGIKWNLKQRTKPFLFWFLKRAVYRADTCTSTQWHLFMHEIKIWQEYQFLPSQLLFFQLLSIPHGAVVDQLWFGGQLFMPLFQLCSTCAHYWINECWSRSSRRHFICSTSYSSHPLTGFHESTSHLKQTTL